MNDMCNNVFVYKRKKQLKQRYGKMYPYFIFGIPVPLKKGYIYKWTRYNKFNMKKPFKLPFGYTKINNSKTKYYYLINKKICKLNSKLIFGNYESTIDKSIHKGYKQYFIHFNGGRPFLVCIKNNNVKIYILNEIASNLNITKNINIHYNVLIKSLKVKKIFIGISQKRIYDGNTILLYLGNNKYIYVGDIIYEFTTKDKIIKYYSELGNSDVPYPIAISNDNVYFMHDRVYVSKTYINKKSNKDLMDAYTQFYSDKLLRQNATKMKYIKIIHRRSF
jgi:hypothetical protein